MRLRAIHLVIWSPCHLAIGLALAAGATALGAEAESRPVSDPAAVRAFEGYLASLKGIGTLEVGFVCEKRLAGLESPPPTVESLPLAVLSQPPATVAYIAPATFP